MTSAWLRGQHFPGNSGGFAALAVAAGVGVGVACSAGGDGAGGPGAANAPSGTGGGSSVPGGTGGTAIIDPIPTGTTDPNDTRDLPIREKVCDAAGVCTCLRLALLGTLDSAANQKDTTPFVAWLNDTSGGTATVTMVNTKPTLDATWLGNYDILLVANVNGWTFSADEKAAVETWVRTTGGGIVSLTGFISQATEPAATSQLIEFSGVKYNASTTAPQSSSQNTPVYYHGGTVNLKNCITGWGSDEAVITAAEKFVPQTDALAKLTLGLDYVGAFIGYGVDAPAGATVVSTDTDTGLNMGVAYEVEGTGRIFAWGDEWVIYSNQWAPANALPGNQQKDQYNPCYVPANGDAPEFFHSISTLYQTKQFWYDVINWVAPPNECNFIIDDPEVVIVR